METLDGGDRHHFAIVWQWWLLIILNLQKHIGIGLCGLSAQNNSDFVSTKPPPLPPNFTRPSPNYLWNNQQRCF